MNDDHYVDDDGSPKSKTRIKHECDVLQKVGEALIGLKPEDLASMNLPEALADAVTEARHLKSRGGLKRQRQYIGKIMREIDSDSIIHQLDAIRHRNDISNVSFRRTERWRDRLIEEGHDAVTELLDAYPEMDHQHVNQLVRLARKEAAEQRPPAASRKLFRYLRDFIEAHADG